MPRIIGGAAKGRRLVVPPHGTRPTGDRTREAMFSTLGGYVELVGRRVLDLYAGSGAVGLEALSRGAAQVTFVESDRAAAAALATNVATVGLPGATVLRRRVSGVLAAGTDVAVGLVFADPPYALDDRELAGVLSALVTGSWLSDDAVVVLERSVRSAEPSWPDGVVAITHRRYGDSALWYGRRR